MYKLSIIVPVYNGEKTIRRAVESLLAQSVKVKIIVINDGSTDSTDALMRELALDYDNVFYYPKKNTGIAATRNFGIDLVDTEYFGFLDADDTVAADMAKKMLGEIERTGADICFSNFTWVYANGSRRLQKDVGYHDKHEILHGMFAVLWNKLYRTSWFKATGIRFPDGLKFEDASLLFRLAYHMDNVCYVDESFVDYYQVGGSITHTFDVEINHLIAVYEGIKDYYLLKGVFSKYRDEIEYLFTRVFLGYFYLKVCRVEDEGVRNEALDKGWTALSVNFPDFNKNKYLKSGGKKDLYYSFMNRSLYYTNVKLFRFLYKVGVMK